jgi:hypothetical protein
MCSEKQLETDFSETLPASGPCPKYIEDTRDSSVLAPLLAEDLANILAPLEHLLAEVFKVIGKGNRGKIPYTLFIGGNYIAPAIGETCDQC